MSETDKQIVIEALGGGPVQVGTGDLRRRETSRCPWEP